MRPHVFILNHSKLQQIEKLVDTCGFPKLHVAETPKTSSSWDVGCSEPALAPLEYCEGFPWPHLIDCQWRFFHGISCFISDRELEKNVKKTNAVYKMERQKKHQKLKHDSCEGFASPISKTAAWQSHLGRPWEALFRAFISLGLSWACDSWSLVTVDVEWHDDFDFWHLQGTRCDMTG